MVLVYIPSARSNGNNRFVIHYIYIFKRTMMSTWEPIMKETKKKEEKFLYRSDMQYCLKPFWIILGVEYIRLKERKEINKDFNIR